MRTVHFHVRNQRIEWDTEQGAVEKTKGYLYADFTFDDDWKDCTITTLWNNSERTGDAIPVTWTGTAIQVPEQCLIHGKLQLSCLGIRYAADTEIYRVTTYEMKPGMQVYPCGPLIGTLPEPVTPSMIEQLMAAAARADSAAENANGVAQKLLESKANGEFDGPQGPQGYTPEIGPNGNWRSTDQTPANLPEE